MPIYTIQAPDGRKIKIEAANEATAVRGARQYVSQNPPSMAMPASYNPANVRQLTGGPGPMPTGSPASSINGFVQELPIIGPIAQNVTDNLMGMGSQLLGGDRDKTIADLRRQRQRIKVANPVGDAAGRIAGAVTGFGTVGATKAGADALGLGQKLIPGVLKGALANQGLYTANEYAKGKSGIETLGNGVPALVGGFGNALGRGAEVAGEGVANAFTRAAQRRATDAATKNAPALPDLRAAASNLFNSARAADAGINSRTMNGLAMDLVKTAKARDIDPDLDTGAWQVYQRMVDMAHQAEEDGGITFGRLHNLRQLAQDVTIEAKKDRTKTLAGAMIDKLDEVMGNIKPAQAWVPSNRLGSTDVNAAGNAVLEGITLWRRASKMALLEEAMTKAGYQKSGLENGLRSQFLAILRDPRKRKLFNKAEIRALEDVARGTPLSNIMTFLGKFGLGDNRIVGPALGAAFGGIPGMLAATGARKASESLAESAAQRAVRAVATPGVPIVAAKRNMLRLPARGVDLLTRASVYNNN